MTSNILSGAYSPSLYLLEGSVGSNLLSISIGLFAFLLLASCVPETRHLCILDASLLSDMRLANIFSQSVTWLFIPLAVRFQKQRVSTGGIPFTVFLMEHTVGAVSSKSWPNPTSPNVPLCFLLDVVRFKFCF